MPDEIQKIIDDLPTAEDLRARLETNAKEKAILRSLLKLAEENEKTT